MPTTNDENEGALGEFRTFAHRFPTGSLSLFNAIMVYMRNNTQNFIDHVLDFDEAQHWLRSEARIRLAEKPDSIKRLAISEQKKIEEADAKRRKYEENAEKRQRHRDHLMTIDLIEDEQA